MDPTNDGHREKAVKILRESVAYGVAMFPDADTNGGRKENGTKDDEDWVMGNSHYPGCVFSKLAN